MGFYDDLIDQLQKQNSSPATENVPALSTPALNTPVAPGAAPLPGQAAIGDAFEAATPVTSQIVPNAAEAAGAGAAEDATAIMAGDAVAGLGSKILGGLSEAAPYASLLIPTSTAPASSDEVPYGMVAVTDKDGKTSYIPKANFTGGVDTTNTSIFDMKPGMGTNGVSDLMASSTPSDKDSTSIGNPMLGAESDKTGPKPAAMTEGEQEKGEANVPGAPEATQEASSVGTKDYLKDMLSKLYGPGLGDEDLKNAQQQRNTMQGLARMSMGANTISAALSRGGAKPENEVNADILKNAGQNIQDILTRRDAQSKQIELGIKASDFNDKQQLSDPTSKISAAYRTMALSADPSLAKLPNFNQMTAEGIKATIPVIDTKAKMQYYKDAHVAAAQQQQINGNYKAAADAEKTTQQKLSSGRGAVGQAAITDFAVKKINELTNEVMARPANAGKTPEQALNNMSTTDMNAYQKEYARILQGGIAGEKEGSTLLPPTWKTSFNTVLGKATGIVQPAEMGSFVAQQMPYVNGLQKVSKDYMKDNILEPTAKMLATKNPQLADEYRARHADYYGGQVSGAPQAAAPIAAPVAISPEAMQLYQQGAASNPGLTPQVAQKILDNRKAAAPQ